LIDALPLFLVASNDFIIFYLQIWFEDDSLFLDNFMIDEEFFKPVL